MNTLADMVAGPLILVGDQYAAALQARAAQYIAAGPAPASKDELRAHRYQLTDQLDDLRGSRDLLETEAIAAHLLIGAAELALITRPAQSLVEVTLRAEPGVCEPPPTEVFTRVGRRG